MIPLPIVAGLFALSGATALGLEAVWTRQFALVFGVAHQAEGMVMVGLAGGIACGLALGGRVAAWASRPLGAFAVCQAIVGAFALASPEIFAGLEARAALTTGAARVLLVLVMMAPATLAMGASLVFASQAVVRSRWGLGRGVGALVAASLAGGCAGASLTGLALLPWLGLAQSARGLGGAALVVAGLAALAAVFAVLPGRPGLPHSAPGRIGKHGDPAPAPSVAQGVGGLVLAVLLGALALALHVAWGRVLASLLGPSALTAVLITSVTLAALSAGTAVGRIEADEPGAWSRMARRFLALAIGTWVGVFAVGAASLAGDGAASILRLGLVALAVAPAGYQIGALVPLVMAQAPGTSPGAVVGRSALAMVIGGVIGILSTGLVLIPTWGVHATVGAVMTGALALTLGTAAMALLDGARGSVVAVALAAVVALVAVRAIDLRWDTFAFSAGAFRTTLYRAQVAGSEDQPQITEAGEHPGATPLVGPLRSRRAARRLVLPCRMDRTFARREVLLSREGSVGHVVVIGREAEAVVDAEACTLVTLRVDGKTEGSLLTRAALQATGIPPGASLVPTVALSTQVLAGALPALAVSGPAAEALVVGWETGASIRALLDAGLARVTVVEREPAVLEAARLFDATLDRDPRVRAVVDDGPAQLRRAPRGSFDVIVSQPASPWVRGAGQMFSGAYFRLIADRLRPGGAALIRVPLHEIDRTGVRAVVATALGAFRDVHAFRPSGANQMLLLARRALPLSRARLLAALQSQSVGRARDALARAGMATAGVLAGTHIGDREALAEWAGGAAILGADSVELEYRAAHLMLAGQADTAATILEGLVNPLDDAAR